MTDQAGPAGARAYVNGKWLAQAASGTQRYATQVMAAVSGTAVADGLTLVLPRDAPVPDWAEGMRVRRSRLRGTLFEQLALPWISRGRHLYSFAGPAPVLKRRQTVVMHDAMPFRFPSTFRTAFVLWYRFMYSVLARTADRVCTVSTFSRAELAQVLRVPEARFDLAPCGADHIRPGDPGGATDLPFPAGGFALLVGNLAPHKNVPATVAALAAAEVPTVVVGGLQQQVFRGIAEAPGQEGVHLLGRVSEETLAALYRAAGVLVAPSRYEGFGIPIVEAGRLGCPSVFALGSSMTEVAGYGGIGYDAHDLDGCVAAVRQVLADPDRRAGLGHRARANADRFRWVDTAAALFGPAATGPAATGPAALFGPAATGPAATGPADRPLRVLHVTETFSAGTGVAVIGFARATAGQGVESYLLAQDRGSGLLDEISGSSPFAGARILPSGLFQLWRGIGRTVAEVRPDVVHLHSSMAGGVGRLRPALGRRRPAVVYSPHCFAFERRDVSAPRRAVFRALEMLLARRTDGFVCVGPHEASLAAGLRSRAAVVSVINSFRAPGPDPGPAAADDPDVATLVTVGRVTPQKDPDLFLRILLGAREAGAPVRATWVGGGDETRVAALTGHGVRVTGWVPSADVPDLMADHSVYLHTAGWEAAVPIAVLDAMAAGLVVVVRRNPAYRDVLPDDWQFDDVATAVKMIDYFGAPEHRAARLCEQSVVVAAAREQGPDHVLAAAYRDIHQKADTQGGPTNDVSQ